MRKLHPPFLMAIALMMGFGLLASCSNTGQKAQSSTEDSQTSVVNFQDQVRDFDSSWQERLQMLNTRIHQYDSSANTYKGSLHAKMEKQLKKIKAERDSLATSLDQVKQQQEGNWHTFQQKVSDQYSNVVESLTDLRNLNQ